MKGSLFREESLKHISSPDELDKYLRITNPGIWIVMVIIMVFFAGILLWSVNGTVPIVKTYVGVEMNGSVHAYVPASDVDYFFVGQPAKVVWEDEDVDSPADAIDTIYTEISDINLRPQSKKHVVSTVTESVGEYEALCLILDSWNNEIVLDASIPVYETCHVYITVEAVQPIKYLFGNT